MSNYNNLKTSIDANIKQNGNQEITGPILNSVLNQMVNILGTGYQFAGVATLDPATDPGTPDAKVFYIANGKGTYTNFGSLEVTEDEVVVLYWDSAWHKVATGIASQAKLSELERKVGDLDIDSLLARLSSIELELASHELRIEALEGGTGERYTLSVSVTNGSVIGYVNDEPITFPYNARLGVAVKLVVIPDAGMEFEGWGDGNTQNPRMVLMDGNKTLTADCVESAKQYTINATPNGGGSIIAKVNGQPISLPYTAAINTRVTLEAVPDDGMELWHWSNFETTNPRTFILTTNIETSCDFRIAAAIPADYLAVQAIKSNGNSTFVSTGFAPDSQSNFDLYWGTGRTSGSNNFEPIFGVRRASGTGDDKSYYIYSNTGTWKALEIGYGGTDIQIPASLYGVPFYNNMHKLSARGGDFYEWDRLILHKELTFSSDGVNAVFGNLAKSNSERYNNNNTQSIFYRLVVYNSDMKVIQDYRPVKRVSDSRLGIYDCIGGNFYPVEGTWLEIEKSDYATIRIVAQIAKGSQGVFQNLNVQGVNYYRGYMVYIPDQQWRFAVHKGAITCLDGRNLIWPTGQRLECRDYNTNWHGNTSWFGADKWSADDFFPLLYVGTDKDNELLCVYRLIGSDPDNLEGIELVQKIHTPRTTKWYFNNYYGMAGSNTFVHTGYKNNSFSDSSNENTIYARVFRLPDPHDGNVELLEDVALTETINLGWHSTTGDGWWTGKYLGITFSNVSETPKVQHFAIWEIEAGNTSIEPIYSIDGFHTIHNPLWLTDSELEGFKYSPSDDIFTLCIEPLRSGRSNIIQYRPFAKYTEVMRW